MSIVTAPTFPTAVMRSTATSVPCLSNYWLSAGGIKEEHTLTLFDNTLSAKEKLEVTGVQGKLHKEWLQYFYSLSNNISVIK